jgi:hypothetical protein
VSDNIILFMIGQAVIILVGLFSSHSKLNERIAELRGMTMQLQITATGLRNDHVSLSDKVDGISRHVAHIEGMEEARTRNGRCKFADKKELL